MVDVILQEDVFKNDGGITVFILLILKIYGTRIITEEKKTLRIPKFSIAF